MDLLLLILITVGVPVLVMSFIPESKWPKPKPKHRRYKSSSNPPKSLPWFDKDYLKRKEKEKISTSGMTEH